MIALRIMGLNLRPRICLGLLRTAARGQAHHGAFAAASPLPLVTTRGKRYEAFDAHLDKEALNEARAWFAGLNASQLPKGSTTFARSSGAGGQHVNK